MVNDFTKVRQGRCVRAVSGTQEFCMQNHLYCTAFSNVSKTLRVRHRHMVIHQTGSPAKVEFCTRHYATYLACIISENCDYRDEPDFYSLSIKYLVHGYISIPESYSMYVAILTSMYFAFGESPSSPNLQGMFAICQGIFDVFRTPPPRQWSVFNTSLLCFPCLSNGFLVAFLILVQVWFHGKSIS